jgi:hypothetical protein
MAWALVVTEDLTERQPVTMSGRANTASQHLDDEAATKL